MVHSISTYNIITGNIFINNSGTTGGVMYTVEESVGKFYYIIADNTFVGNSANSGGIIIIMQIKLS